MQMSHYDDKAYSIYKETFSPSASVRFRREPNVVCKRCGSMLDTYYCERQLYAVRCLGCSTVSFVLAPNPAAAAQTFGLKLNKEDNLF